MDSRLEACSCCSLIQHVPVVEPGYEARCRRCATVLHDPSRPDRGPTRTLAATLAALLLYPAAFLLPIMTIERFGHRTEASLYSGSFGLIAGGDVLVGTVVLVCSVLLPLAKLLGLLVVNVRRPWLTRHRRASTYRWIERLGRFGMLDVLLLALLVAWVKVGDLVEIHPGPGALAFTGCVLASLLASAWFDPRRIFAEEEPA